MTRAVLVNPTGELVFASAALAGNQHGGGGIGHFIGKFKDAQGSGSVAIQGIVAAAIMG